MCDDDQLNILDDDEVLTEDDYSDFVEEREKRDYWDFVEVLEDEGFYVR